MYNSNFNFVMIDIETLSTSSDACVATLGAIVFNSNSNNIKEFYCRIDLDSCDKLGLTRRQDTIDFWNKQDEEARKEIFGNNDRVDIRDAMINFKTFFRENKCTEVWCNGANFDEPILSNVYEKLKIEKPWKFWNVRCVRTLMSLAGLKMKDFGTVSHHALDDCKKQILAVEIAKKKLCLL